jgi:hypothetical protein
MAATAATNMARSTTSTRGPFMMLTIAKAIDAVLFMGDRPRYAVWVAGALLAHVAFRSVILRRG